MAAILESKTNAEVQELFEKAKENLFFKGNAEAQYKLGIRFCEGQGVEKDMRQAAGWFRKAAEQKHAKAQYNLGVMLADGRGIAKDEREAAVWFRKAAEQEHAKAQYNLGVMLAHALGIAKDERQAVEWYYKAAEQEHAKAQYNLGNMLRDGRGIAKDERQAVEYYGKAAQKGVFGAEKTAKRLNVEPWTIIKDEKQSVTLTTNGKMVLALEFHPYKLQNYMASHQMLLNYQYPTGFNKVEFIQKYVASGAKQCPNENSVAFTQALEYSLSRYYRLRLPTDEQEGVAQLFSLPETTTPTLSLFDILLSDFISKSPRGVWRSHTKDSMHFNEMTRCHEKVKRAFENGEDTKHKTVIETTMQIIVQYLYRALHAFKDHKIISEIEFSEEELRLMEKYKFTDPKTLSDFKRTFLGTLDNEIDLFHAKSALNEKHKTEAILAGIAAVQSVITKKPYYEKTKKDPLAEGVKHLKEIIETSRHYINEEDNIRFLKELRNIIFNKECPDRQMLGIGFHGSFFDAESDSFDDEPAVHLCFTEKYRIAGSIFLGFVGYYLSQVLTKEFNLKVHVRTGNNTDLLQKLMYHYTIDYVWSQIVNNPMDVNEELFKKVIFLVNEKLKSISKDQKEQVHLAAYLDLEKATMLNELTQLTTKIDACEFPLTNKDHALKFGKYVLNLKMYPCVEAQLVPFLNSGWIFPIILNPNIPPPAELLSFEFKSFGGYTFYVAKPCKKYCQLASTAYDITAEIKFHFAQVRGFVGTSFTEGNADAPTISFSSSEQAIIDKILNKEKINEYIEHRLSVHESCYKAQVATPMPIVTKDPSINAVIDKKNGFNALHQAVNSDGVSQVRDLIAKGADVNYKSKSGWTPLYMAACKGFTEVVNELIKAKADVNVQDGKQYTPLHFAVNYGHTDVVKLLLPPMSVEIVNAKDNEGKTAIDRATEKKHSEMVDLIRSKVKL